MIPSAPHFLAYAVHRLTNDIAPALPDEYLAQSTGMMGGMMAVATQQADCAVDDMVWDITQLHELLTQATVILEHAQTDQPDFNSLRLSSLIPQYHRLAIQLVEVHALVEEMTSAQARALNARIWDYLTTSAQRRRIDIFD